MILNSAKNKTKSADLGSKNGPPKNLAPPSADSTTHRYREIADSGYCTNTVGVQLTGGETKQQAYNSLEIFSE